MSYIISMVGVAFCIAASLIKGKRMRMILLLLCIGNFLVATSYFFTKDGMNGAVSGYLGAGMIIINSFFEQKQKKIPGWLIITYGAVFVGANLIADVSVYSILAIAATLSFVFSIGQPSGARYRVFVIFNAVFWCAYDFLTASYSGLAAHTALLLFTVAGMIIHDRKKA